VTKAIPRLARRKQRMEDSSYRRRGIGDNRGFTLLEILVALAILSIGICALAGMQVTNIKSTGFNKDASIATGLAQKKIEELKNTVFDSIVSNTAGVVDSGMTVTWNVNAVGTAPNRYKDVSVTTRWGTGNISCYTIITEP
jgi:type II secretion system protein I